MRSRTAAALLCLALSSPAFAASPSSWRSLDASETSTTTKWNGGGGSLQVWGDFTGPPTVTLEWQSHATAPWVAINSTACSFTAAGFCSFSIGNGLLRVVVTGGTGADIVSAYVGQPNQASAGTAGAPGGSGGGSTFWTDDGSTGTGLVPTNPDAITVDNDGVGGGNEVKVLADTGGQTDRIFEVLDSAGSAKLSVDDTGIIYVDHADNETGPGLRFLDGTSQDSWKLYLLDAAAGGVVFGRASSSFLEIRTDQINVGKAAGPRMSRDNSTLTHATLLPSRDVDIGLGGDATAGALVHGSTTSLDFTATEVNVLSNLTVDANGAKVADGLRLEFPQATTPPTVTESGSFWETDEKWLCIYDGVRQQCFSQIHGELHGTTGTISLSTEDTYFQWTDATVGPENGITGSAATDDMDLPYDGDYRVDLDTSFGGPSNDVITCNVHVNGSPGTIFFDREMNAGGDVGAASAGGALSLSAADVLEVFCKNASGDGTGTLTIVRFALMVQRL